ncbi:hypothetical protein DEA8626_03829 [Defluviimonas aquaemixtae]|uniref:Fatty acid hydroxylase domain-containing protein n=1 Tax=Albidovulum aquaemixtae TaxID=1542388 RepID=A0A2R8BMX7_9RHOB|nr:sterol desaturase family protein [Defluviimonas aquaemixtae]SPH24792.1 hypothetical protein DEA8626_03829 [Defluviimonas aquaemixtae]
MFCLSTLAGLYSGVFAEDLARYVIAAGGTHLAVNLAFGPALAHRRVRDEPRPGTRQIAREVAASLRTVVIFAAFGTTIAAGAQAGLLPVYLHIADYGPAWLAVSLALLIVGHDTWFYWSHRLLHHPRLFRPLHRLHHRSHNPTAFTAYSFNFGEAFVHATYLPLALAVIPAHPLVIFLFTAHMILRNAIGHCGTELFPATRDGRPLLDWLTTVTHHDLHHENGRCNLGLYFTWWDRFCGTEHPAYLARFRAALGRTAMPVLAAAFGLTLLGEARADTLSGGWASEGLSLVVRFAPCEVDAARVCGRLAHVRDASDARHVAIGGVMVDGLRANGDGWDGRLNDPATGRVYRGHIRLIDRDTMELKGCTGPVCKRQIWRSTRWLERMTRPPVPFP